MWRAGLNAAIILVLPAVVIVKVPFNAVVKNLTDLDIGIDANGLHAKHLQGPVTAEADVAKPCRDMDKQSQATNGGAAFEHGDQIVGCGVLAGAVLQGGMMLCICRCVCVSRMNVWQLFFKFSMVKLER